jgi:hypothetical protein
MEEASKTLDRDLKEARKAGPLTLKARERALHLKGSWADDIAQGVAIAEDAARRAEAEAKYFRTLAEHRLAML